MTSLVSPFVFILHCLAALLRPGDSVRGPADSVRGLVRVGVSRSTVYPVCFASLRVFALSVHICVLVVLSHIRLGYGEWQAKKLPSMKVRLVSACGV